jgi:hypothetical protein
MGQSPKPVCQKALFQWITTRRSELFGAFLLLLISALAASPLQEAWLAGDRDQCELIVSQGCTEAERLLVRSLSVKDPEAVLNYMRSISSLDGPEWVRRDALTHLCDHFCVTEDADSLAFWRSRFEIVLDDDYSCALSNASTLAWSVQVGAFSSEANAAKALKKLKDAGITVHVIRDDRIYRALGGHFDSKRDAKRAGRDWKERGLIEDYRPYRQEERK